MTKIILMCAIFIMSSCAYKKQGTIVTVVNDGEIQKMTIEGYVDRKTMFRLASLTKAFTGMSILILEEQNKIHEDDYVVKYIPEIPLFKGIRIKHLVHHTSGLPYFGELCKEKGSPVTNRDVLNWLKEQKQTRFEPGLKYEYSNTGYIVLAEIISRISGKSYSEFVTEKIFLPLGMNDSVFHKKDPENANTCNFTMGEDGIYTTIDDYMKWTKAITTDSLIKDRSKIFTAPQNYSYGWTVMSPPGINHYGAWMNYRTHARYYSQKDTWIIILSNNPEIPMEKVIKEATIWVGY